MTTPGVLGLDIGGSKTHAVLRTDEGARELLRGSANTAAVGTEAAAAVLHGLARDLCPDGVLAVCAGAAGADTHRSDSQMSRLLHEAFPGAAIRVVHDSRIVLAAEGLTAGSVLIAGTGSVAWARASTGEEV